MTRHPGMLADGHGAEDAMRRAVIAMAVLGLWAGAASAKEGWKRLAGKPPPAFEVQQWLNTDGADPTPKSLVGKVWMIEFLSVG